MIKMLKKNAVSGHIEIFFSFLIFLAFAAFLLAFINPIEKAKDNNYYLETTKKAMIENLSVNVSVFSITLEPSVPYLASGCYCFPYDFPEALRAIDQDGNAVSAGTYLGGIGNKICFRPSIDTAIAVPTIRRHYKLRFSEEFSEDSFVCSSGTNVDLTLDQYALGVRNEYKMISNKSMYLLRIDFESNYDLLKEELSLNNNFNVLVRDLENKMLLDCSNEAPNHLNVIAEDSPVEVVFENGGVVSGIMNVQAW